MNKKERKQLEEKISITVLETIKNNGITSTASLLKNVKKHAKAISKKIEKEIVAAAEKAVATKTKRATIARKTPSKKISSATVKRVPAAQKK